jgi:hypothetical protein
MTTTFEVVPVRVAGQAAQDIRVRVDLNNESDILEFWITPYEGRRLARLIFDVADQADAAVKR